MAEHATIADDLVSLAVDIDTVRQLPGNPRRGDVDAVAASLQRFGQRKPIVVDADGVIRARVLELDPIYVDVICRRWQEYTGSKPVLEATGEPHDFTETP